MSESCSTSDTEPTKIQSQISNTCLKCKNNPSLLIFRTSSICWICFRETVFQRFKANLVRMRDNKHSTERLLVGISGGLSSVALIYLLSEFMGGNGKKKFFEIHLVHIYVPLFQTPQDERIENHRKLYELSRTYGFPLTIVSLESVISDSPETFQFQNIKSLDQENLEGETITNQYIENTVLKEQLSHLFSQIQKDQTSKEDFLKILQMRLLFRIALENSFPKILTGETASRLAINLLSSVSKGKGFTIPNQCNLIEQIIPNGLTLVRPLKDFLVHEIAIFHRKQSLPSITIPNLSTMIHFKSSLNLLSENFLLGLQRDFPHTSHTLLRTVDKLYTPSENSVRCSLCQGLLTEKEISNSDLEKKYCYSCSTICAHFTHPISFSEIGFSHPLTQEQLKEEIGSFLLADNDE